MTPKFTPAIGQIVHYTSFGTPGGEFGQECRAAIVTALHPRDGVLDLCVVNPTGLFFNQGVLQDNAKQGGTWHWPAFDA